LLDEDSLAEMVKLATELEFQIWMARVDTTGKMGIVLENGEVKTNNYVAAKTESEPEAKEDKPKGKKKK